MKIFLGMNSAKGKFLNLRVMHFPWHEMHLGSAQSRNISSGASRPLVLPYRQKPSNISLSTPTFYYSQAKLLRLWKCDRPVGMAADARALTPVAGPFRSGTATLPLSQVVNLRIPLKAISDSGPKPIRIPERNRSGVGAKRRWFFDVAKPDRNRQAKSVRSEA
jgi:hypothetical protein